MGYIETNLERGQALTIFSDIFRLSCRISKFNIFWGGGQSINEEKYFKSEKFADFSAQNKLRPFLEVNFL